MSHSNNPHVLIIAEHDNQHLNNSTRHVLAAAALLSNNITLFVAGYHCDSVAQEAAKTSGVTHVLLADKSYYEHHLPENLANCVVSLLNTQKFQFVLAPSTTFGKNVLPRIAALCDTEQLSDICQIIKQPDDETIAFIRPIYAGNALETIISHSPIQVMTIRTSAFPISAVVHQEAVSIETLESCTDLGLSQFIHIEATESKRPDLTQAKIVVSGGRGFQSAEKFKLIETLADTLNAAIGASRAAVDAGFAPNDYQVGQTGKIVAPNLYIALGISGAIQHLAGMKDSRVIVAINKDAEAPIFKIATYGLVGDLFNIIPELIAELNK